MHQSVLDMTDQELAVESAQLIGRILQVLDEYHRRHPDDPIWHLLALSLRNSASLQAIEDKHRLMKMPPATKKKQ